MIRPLLPSDAVAARSVTWRALYDLDSRLGDPVQELTPALVQRSESRILHLQATDPDSAWVAEVDGEVVGCALALVRDGMWFLSLLMVDPEHQGRGLGRQLLDAALQTAGDRAWLLATADPAALRRYQKAGFELHAGYAARGVVDRTRVPAVQGVRVGSCDSDADLIDAVTRGRRGAGLDPDLPYLISRDVPLVVVDGPQGQGFALLRPDGVMWLGATTEDAARRLLWTALGETSGEVEVDFLTANQQWAIDVSLQAGLSLTGRASTCLRGQPPMDLYLPSGALG